MRPKTVHEDLAEVKTDKIRFIATSLADLNAMGRPHTDQEVGERIDQYFEYCANHGIRPGVESLALALHCDRTTIYKWRKGQGCSQERQRTINNAMQYIFSFLEMLGLTGQVNPATFIWMTKQWMNYKDSISIEENSHVREDHRDTLDTKKLIEQLGIEDIDF